MSSIAQNQFPRVTWHENRRYLWNPVQRKKFKNRPEERVRLRVIEYLLDTGWSKNRISTEEAIQDYTDATLRTDLICYSRDFNPCLLVECKAEYIPISTKTARQSARYNREVAANYLLMTNGNRDYWYKVDTETQTIQKLNRPPDIFNRDPGKTPVGRTHDFWEKRGFAGNAPPEPMMEWLEQVLEAFWDDDLGETRYLKFNHQPTGYPIDHYYKIYDSHTRPPIKTAVTFTSTPTGETHMLGILARKGRNEALVQIKLDAIFNGISPNTVTYSEEGTTEISLADKYSYSTGDLKKMSVDELKECIAGLMT